MIISNILFYLYLLLKPFYLFESGGLQISDYFLIMSFVFTLLNKNKIKSNLSAIIQKNKEYIIFLIIVITINLIYFVIYNSSDFLLFTSYYIYNFIAIILFIILSNNDNFLKNINKIMKINIVIQFLIYLLGLGRWYGLIRYMGTFNDPNQFAYFILLSYSWIYLLSKKYKYNSLLYFLLAIFLIIESSSTGMLLGICIFMFFQIYNFILKLKNDITIKNKIKRVFYCSIYLCCIAAIIVLISSNNGQTSAKFNISNITIINRLEGKLKKVDSNKESLWQERGYDRIYYYPQYVLFGAGEGKFDRWKKAFHQGELHATLPSILFNYGIISLILVCKWIYNKIKGTSFEAKLVCIALLTESFTLINSRQSLFWLIIVFFEYYKPQYNENKELILNKGEII